MRVYRADLHTHTVLSPCGDLEMSARNIINAALEKGIEILGITDHNSTLNSQLIKMMAEKEGLFVLTGAEVTTREEIHCLCFLEHGSELEEFQEWIEKNITRIPNSPQRFGYQVVIDEEDNIIDEVEYLLIMSLSKTIDEVERKVHELNGLFIPAHVDRPVNSILSQLGFFPPLVKYDAIEVTPYVEFDELRIEHPLIGTLPYVRSSDSHFLHNVGKVSTGFYLNEMSFSEIRMALKGERGRKVIH
ncbi:MAG: PHP domain-containing protein [Bacteroidales bacterium]